jgi:hypothetical protein
MKKGVGYEVYGIGKEKYRAERKSHLPETLHDFTKEAPFGSGRGLFCPKDIGG